MTFSFPPRARIAVFFVLVAVVVWTALVACGSSETETAGLPDASPDVRTEASKQDSAFVPEPTDAASFDARPDKDAARLPPHCLAPVVCTDAGTEPTELARFSENVWGITADGCDVYWGDEGGTIRSMPRCGGPVKTIASGETYPVIALTMDAWSVYWTAGGVIRGASKSGGIPFTLASDATQQPWAIAVDDAFVYWTDNHGFGSRLFRVPVGGGAREEVALIGGGGSQAYGMALDKGRVFFAGDQIRSALADGGDAIDLGGIGTVNDLWCIAVNDLDVYYTRYASNVVMRVPRAGGDASVFAPAAFPRCMAVDNGSVYWANDAIYDAGLMRAPTDGGPLTVISALPGPGASGFVALDESYVYWGYGSRLLRAPK